MSSTLALPAQLSTLRRSDDPESCFDTNDEVKDRSGMEHIDPARMNALLLENLHMLNEQVSAP